MKLLTRTCASLSVLIATLITLVSFSHAQELRSCDCPGKDPLANPACGPIPAKLKSGLYARGECPPKTEKGFAGLVSVKAAAKAMYVAASMIKEPEDVLDYMSCYAERAYDRSKADKIPSRNYFCHFKTTLAPQIALAAESSGLPFAIQACLFFRESKFHSELTSPAGAKGYIQFMPDTVKVMSSALSVSTVEYQKKIKETTALKKAAQKELQGKVSDATRSRLKKDIIYYDGLITAWKGGWEARRSWDRYWGGTPNAGSIKITNASVKCPQVAFALSMAKQVRDLRLLTGGWDDDYTYKRPTEGVLTINGMSERESNLLLSGVYNAGVAGVAERCGDVKRISDCASKLPEETRKYIASIRSCSTRGSDNPMKGYNDKKCEDFKCKK